MKRILLAGLAVLLGQAVCFATPDRTISVSPVAVSGETVSANDENSRNNEISTKFNEHSHNDITVLTSVNTFTIGDGAVGSKTYAVNTDQSNDPGVRYNTSTDLWTLSNDGSSYLAVAHSADSNGISSGQMLYGGISSGAIVSASATNGQILIGSSSGTPKLSTISGSGGITIGNGDGSISVQHAVDGFATPALTLGTSNSAGNSSTAIRSNATVAAFDTTVPASVGTANATGSASVAARRDHVHNANNAWQFVESLIATSGTTLTSATLPTDSDLFMVVFEGVTATTSQTISFNPNGDTDADKDYVIMTNATPAKTDGQAGFIIAGTGSTNSKPINGVLYIPRLASNSDIHITGNVVSGSNGSDDNLFTFLAGHWDGGAETITTLGFTVSGGQAFTAGKIHIYKSVPS